MYICVRSDWPSVSINSIVISPSVFMSRKLSVGIVTERSATPGPKGGMRSDNGIALQNRFTGKLLTPFTLSQQYRDMELLMVAIDKENRERISQIKVIKGQSTR